MCCNLRAVARHIVKGKFGQAVVEEFAFHSSHISLTNPYAGCLVPEDHSRSSSTRFIICLHFCATCPNLMSASQPFLPRARTLQQMIHSSCKCTALMDPALAMGMMSPMGMMPPMGMGMPPMMGMGMPPPIVPVGSAPTMMHLDSSHFDILGFATLFASVLNLLLSSWCNWMQQAAACTPCEVPTGSHPVCIFFDFLTFAAIC